MEYSDSTICRFLAGLAFLAMAATAARACRKTHDRQIWLWLAVLGGTQGVVAWTGLLAVLVGRSWFSAALQGVAWVGASVALVEAGQRLHEPRRAWLLPRAAYFVLRLIALLCVGFSHAGWIVHEYRAVLVWQAGVMGLLIVSQSFAKPESRLTAALQISVGALLLGLIATCFQITPVVALAALIAAACVWFSHRQGQLGRAGWMRESLAPVSFLLIAAVGCLALERSQATPAEFALISSVGTVGHDAGSANDGTESGPDSPELGEAGGSQEFQILEAVAASPELRRIGMAVIPIVAFVLVIVGLSRLPSAQ